MALPWVTFKEPLEIQNVRGGGEFKTRSCHTSSLVPWVFRTTDRVHATNARAKACVFSSGSPLKDLSSHQAERTVRVQLTAFCQFSVVCAELL